MTDKLINDPVIKKMALEKLGFKIGKLYKVKHWYNDNQNRWLDKIFIFDGEKLIDQQTQEEEERLIWQLAVGSHELIELGD